MKPMTGRHEKYDEKPRFSNLRVIEFMTSLSYHMQGV